jgi:hypothetical protein
VAFMFFQSGVDGAANIGQIEICQCRSICRHPFIEDIFLSTLLVVVSSSCGVSVFCNICCINYIRYC